MSYLIIGKEKRVRRDGRTFFGRRIRYRDICIGYRRKEARRRVRLWWRTLKTSNPELYKAYLRWY